MKMNVQKEHPMKTEYPIVLTTSMIWIILIY